MKVEWTSENEEKYKGMIIEYQRHYDGKFLIIDAVSELELLKKTLIKKGIISQEDINKERKNV